MQIHFYKMNLILIMSPTYPDDSPRTMDIQESLVTTLTIILMSLWLNVQLRTYTEISGGGSVKFLKRNMGTNHQDTKKFFLGVGWIFWISHSNGEQQ